MIQIEFEKTNAESLPEYAIAKHGSKCLYDENGKLHSYNDMPAVIGANGYKAWYKHGKKHRDNDLPAVICKKNIWEWGTTGINEWWLNGKFIREENS